MQGALEIQLERHWRQYLPKMTAELERDGVLQDRLHETADQMRDQYAELVSKGVKPDQAREMTREIGFLPAEQCSDDTFDHGTEPSFTICGCVSLTEDGLREPPASDVTSTLADHAIYREGDTPAPVSPDDPLVGLETEVLKVWKANSPNVRRAHRQDAAAVESAVRRAVFDALQQEATLRAQGLYPHEAQEFTRPAMWAPPTFPVKHE